MIIPAGNWHLVYDTYEEYLEEEENDDKVKKPKEEK